MKFIYFFEKQALNRIQDRSTIATIMLAMMVAAGNAHSATLTFNDAFGTKGEPQNLHYQASYVQNGQSHQLSVWRQADRRLKRSTDEVLETYVFRQSDPAEFEMVVLDKKRMMRTDINRTNLIRIGQFTDWFDLAHGLKHPMGAHQIHLAPTYKGATAPLKPCKWFEVQQTTSTTRVCWSSAYKLPMLMENTSGQVIWQIQSISTASIQPEVFQISDVGYVKNNANTDIERD